MADTQTKKAVSTTGKRQGADINITKHKSLNTLLVIMAVVCLLLERGMC